METAEAVAASPLAGRMVPERELPQIRERIVGPYRMIYRITSDGVEILMIHHGARHLRL